MERLPRLARDSWRAWVATGIAFVPAVAASAAYSVNEVLEGRRPSQIISSLISILLVFALQFLVYQVLTWRVFARLDPADLQRFTAGTTPATARARRLETLMAMGPKAWSIFAALAALVGALAIALSDELRASAILVALSLLSVATGWTMVIFAYALKYLRQHVEHPGLVFPGRPELVWRDYFYLAVQVSTTFSTSDVEVTTTDMRGTVTAQSIVAFVFNTVIVALLVSALLTFA